MLQYDPRYKYAIAVKSACGSYVHFYEGLKEVSDAFKIALRYAETTLITLFALNEQERKVILYQHEILDLDTMLSQIQA